MIARRAPRIDSKLRSISSGRAWVSTWIVTSVGHEILLDELADKGEIGLRRGRKADLDLLEAELDQQVEHAALAVGPHRLDQRLVAVAQIDAAPDRGAVDDPRRPAPVGQIDRGEWAVFVDRHTRTSRSSWCGMTAAAAAA